MPMLSDHATAHVAEPPAMTEGEVATINAKHAARMKEKTSLGVSATSIVAKPSPYTWKASAKQASVPLSTYQKMLGYTPRPGENSTSHSTAFGAEAPALLAVSHSLPKTVDWRDPSTGFGCVSTSNVRNQGQCGSCYAVSSASTVSDRRCIASGGKTKAQYASEPIIACGNQCAGWNLKDTWDLWMVHGSVPQGTIPYSSADLAVPSCRSVRAMTGCGGGVSDPHGGPPSTGPTSAGHQTAVPVPIQPFEASFSTNPTMTPMTSVEYEGNGFGREGPGLGVGAPPSAAMHTCSPASTTLVTAIPTPLNHYTKADDPFAIRSATNTLASNAAAMKAVLAAAPQDGGGPIQAGFTVTRDFFAYKSGVYQPTSSDVVGGHAVEIVGYDDTSDPPSWIVRNSWGPQWGDGGFFKIRQYTNPADIPDIPNFIVFEKTAHVGTPV